MLAVAAGLLAALPARAGRAARVLLPGAGLLAAALAVAGTRPSPGASADALARLLFVLLAVVVAALAVAAALPGAPPPPAAGLRLRVMRGGLPGAGAAALLAAMLADAGRGIGRAGARSPSRPR